jgi:hypothetical protein
MNVFRWIQASTIRSSAALALLYLAVVLGGKLAMRAGVPNALPLTIVAVGAAIMLTGVFVRSAGIPRWALVVAAGVLAVGTPLAAIVAHDPVAYLKGPLGAMGYNWYYLLVVAGIPAGSRAG